MLYTYALTLSSRYIERNFATGKCYLFWHTTLCNPYPNYETSYIYYNNCVRADAISATCHSLSIRREIRIVLYKLANSTSR